MSKGSAKSREVRGRDGQLEEELRISEAKFRGLFDNVNSGVAVYAAKDDGEDFIFVDFNRAGERIEKTKKEDLIGKSIVDAFPGAKEFGLFEVFQRVWRTGNAEHHPISLYKDERILGWRENYVFKLPSGEIMAVYDDMTEQKQSEHVLRMSEQCFRAIADYTYFWEIWISPHGNLVWTNPAAQRVTGYTIQELMSMRDYPAALIHEEDRGRMNRAFNSAMKGTRGKGVEFRLRRKDGIVVWVDISWQPLYDDKGVSQGYRASVRDITARKRAEDALRLTQFSLDSAADAVFWMGPDARFVYANEKACKSLGYSKDELLLMTVHDVDPDFPREVWEEHWEEMRRKSSFVLESHHRRKDGHVFPVEVSVNYLKFGTEEYNCAFVRDITDRKRAAEALQRTNRALKVLSECNQVLVRATDESTLLCEICRTIAEVGKYRLAWVGYAEDNEDKTVQPVAWSGYNEGYLESMKFTWADRKPDGGPTRAVIRTGRPSVSREITTNADGSPWEAEAVKRGYASAIALPLMFEDRAFGALTIYSSEVDAFDADEIKLLSELTNDLSFGIQAIRMQVERGRMEAALHESEERFRILYERAPLAYQSLDVKGRFIDVNPKWLETLGYSREEVIGHWFGDFLAFESAERFKERFSRFKAAGKTQGVEFKMLKKDGSSIMVSFDGRIGHDDQGKFKQTHCIFKDITDRKRAEEKLAEYQEQLRLLASELSLAEERLRRQIATDIHDNVGQNLALSKIKLDSLAKSVGTSEVGKKLKEIREIIAETIKSVRTMTFELSPPVLYELGFEAAVKWLVNQMEQRHGISASFHSTGKIGPFEHNVLVFLFQAIRELLFNVVKHAQADKVTVSARRAGSAVHICVKDDGVGFEMSKADLSDSGMKGFGLFSIRERLGSVGGGLDVDSSPGQGTSARLVAPVKNGNSEQKNCSQVGVGV